jgi:hypothetical protein
MAIIVRYALTLKEPNLLPADVNKRELNVQRHEVRIAADSPIKFDSKFVTFLVQTQHVPYDFKPFQLLMPIIFSKRTEKNQTFVS